jgi:hypothetical protein
MSRFTSAATSFRSSKRKFAHSKRTFEPAHAGYRVRIIFLRSGEREFVLFIEENQSRLTSAATKYKEKRSRSNERLL